MWYKNHGGDLRKYDPVTDPLTFPSEKNSSCRDLFYHVQYNRGVI